RCERGALGSDARSLDGGAVLLGELRNLCLVPGELLRSVDLRGRQRGQHGVLRRHCAHRIAAGRVRIGRVLGDGPHRGVGPRAEVTACCAEARCCLSAAACSLAASSARALSAAVASAVEVDDPVPSAYAVIGVATSPSAAATATAASRSRAATTTVTTSPPNR